MKRPIEIYLGDLTYDTVSLSVDGFPLNIGYIASYCRNRFGSRVNISLFKYIRDLEQAIHDKPPDILGLSNYAWNRRIGREMFRIVKKQNKDILTVWGGPNFPVDLPSQEKFMQEYQEMDVYVPLDGEVGFSNIVESALKADFANQIRQKVLEKPRDGCIIRGRDNKLQFTIPTIRFKHLDEIPSPYLTGLMDGFFDGKLNPMLQTNRGCPFSCTFCVDGNDEVNIVNQFSKERVTSEVNYFGMHVPENTQSLIISDLNFGMMPRDVQTCNAIAEIQKKYNYPKNIVASTGKNAKEKIIEAVKSLHGALFLWMSVQSMDEQILTNIKRDNISVDQMLALAPSIKKASLHTSSEVILGLPGETYDSHVNSLRTLIKAKIDRIVVYTCMMLDGSEMNIPAERKKWQLETKYRVLPRDFVKLSNGKLVLEIEEVVIASNSLSFEEYVKCRMLAFSIYVTKIDVVYDALIKFLQQQNIDVFELLNRTVSNLNNAPENIRRIFSDFKKSTVNELWDSPEDIESHYQDEHEYQKLLNGEDGINVIQYYYARVVAEFMGEWTEYVLKIAHDLLRESHNFNEGKESQFSEIGNFCRGISRNVLDESSINLIPEFLFNYDFIKWVNDSNDISLESFRLPHPAKIQFKLTDEQYKLVQEQLKVFGDTPVGRAQVVKRTSVQMLWRNPVLVVSK